MYFFFGSLGNPKNFLGPKTNSEIRETMLNYSNSGGQCYSNQVAGITFLYYWTKATWFTSLCKISQQEKTTSQKL